VRRVDNLNHLHVPLPLNLGASTSWNPQGLSRPVMGLLYLYCEVVLVCVINEADRCYTILSFLLSVCFM